MVREGVLMHRILAIVALLAGLAYGQLAARLIPVREWPRVIALDGNGGRRPLL